MLLSLLCFLAPFQSLKPTSETDEMRQRRITPIVRVFQTASPAVVFIQTQGTSERGRDIFGRIRAVRSSVVRPRSMR